MKSITAKEAYTLTQNDNAIIIDVREEDEFKDTRIDGVLFCPLSNFVEAIQNIDFAPYQNKKIIFQCLKGGRSAQALNYVQENILKDHDLYNLEGGILSWLENDLPVIHGE